jgi:hypothetical protein
MKLSEDPNVPSLPGWVNITEAAELLGISRQHSYKKATLFGKRGGWDTLHRIGSQPAYVIALSEIEEIKAAREDRVPKLVGEEDGAMSKEEIVP